MNFLNKKNNLTFLSSLVLLLIIIISIFAPYFAPYHYSSQNLANRLAPPSSENFFGTDGYGRDVFSRIIWGSRVSIIIGFGATALALLIGISLGAAAGYYGGKIDNFIMRITDIMISIPPIFLILTIISLFGANLLNTIIVIGSIYWTKICRIVRSEFLVLKKKQFIEAAKVMGAKDLRIIFRHLLPNAAAPIIVQASLFVAQVILIESALSFLGLGVQPPIPSWGNMLTEGYRYISLAWWISVFPGLAIFIMVMFFNLLGDGLREVFDPNY